MATVKTWNGIPWASIKTLNGTAKANVKAIGGTSAGATIVSALDTFDRADANPINNPASDGVSQWTSGQGRLNGIKIASNSCQGLGTPSGGVINNVSFAAKQRVSITLTSTVTGLGILFRSSLTTADAYLLYLTTTQYQFYRVRESGTAITAIGAVINLGLTAAAGDVIMVEADGNSFQAYHNGTPKGTARSDGEADPYTAGSCGVYLGNTTPTIASFSATDF